MGAGHNFERAWAMNPEKGANLRRNSIHAWPLDFFGCRAAELFPKHYPPADMAPPSKTMA